MPQEYLNQINGSSDSVADEEDPSDDEGLDDDADQNLDGDGEDLEEGEIPSSDAAYPDNQGVPL